jgi:lipoate-protein ligase A
MEKVVNRNKESVFKNREIVLFGYDVMNIGRSLAVDEALLRLADKEERFFLRFYDVPKPSAVLAINSHPDIVKNVANGDFDVARRISGGLPIYLNHNTLQYTIAGPLREGDALNTNSVTSIHKSMGGLLTETINDMIGSRCSVWIGDTSSIRANGYQIAGHAQHPALNHSFLYQGVIVIGPWDVNEIKKALNITEEDSKKIANLPSIKGISANGDSAGFYKEMLRETFLTKLPVSNCKDISAEKKEEILEVANRIYDKTYGKDDWIYKGDGRELVRDSKFCILFEDVKPKQGASSLPT